MMLKGSEDCLIHCGMARFRRSIAALREPVLLPHAKPFSSCTVGSGDCTAFSAGRPTAGAAATTVALVTLVACTGRWYCGIWAWFSTCELPDEGDHCPAVITVGGGGGPAAIDGVWPSNKGMKGERRFAGIITGWWPWSGSSWPTSRCIGGW